MIGPVQLLVFGFDSLDKFEGRILDQLEAVAPLNAVRILDTLFVAKEENGDLVALEVGDLGDEPGDEMLGTIIGALMGFSFEGEDAAAPPSEITDVSAIGVTVEDVRRIGRDIPPGTAAALMLVEHHWAGGLRDAIADAGGSVILQGFLTLEGLAMVGAELFATAEAMAAIEVADALEAEATVRSIEALATIELATEVQAAVVAQTILGLVEAGYIEGADAEEAVAAILGDAMPEVQTTEEGNS